MPERVNVNGTLFLHVGKAGGGTVMEHVQGLGFNVVTAHPNPIPHNPQIHTYLMNLRDPVDRFWSNFYHEGLLACHPRSNNETRKGVFGFDRVARDPHIYCRNKKGPYANPPAVAVMVHDLYEGDAEKMMNAICNFNDKEAREKALEGIQILPHAKHSISDWLTSLGDGITNDHIHSSSTNTSDNSSNGTSTTTTLVGIVLEAGFNFKKQIEDALTFALDQKEGAVTIEASASQLERNASAIIKEAAIALEMKEKGQKKKNNGPSLHKHSSYTSEQVSFPPFVKRMQAHQKKNISDSAACCMASTVYREDYTKWLMLLNVEDGNTGTTTWTTSLGELVCNGPSEGTCKEALVAIAKRHSLRRCDALKLGIAASNVMESAVVEEIVDEPLFFNEERTLSLVKDYTAFCFVGLGLVVFRRRRKRKERKDPLMWKEIVHSKKDAAAKYRRRRHL